MSLEERIHVVIDTREQAPWTFASDKFATTIKGLPTGDYSIVGMEDRLTIERKSLGDFVNTVVHDWIRFRKELHRMSGFDVAAIVVEASMDDVVRHQYESAANPASILGRMNGIFLDHGIPVFLWGDRVTAAVMAAGLLTQAWRKLK